MTAIVIGGSGDLALEILWVAQCANEVANPEKRLEVVGFFDDVRSDGATSVAGLPIFRSVQEIKRKHAGKLGFVVAIGHNEPRRKVAELLTEAGLEPVNVIHPSAAIAPTAELGRGVMIEAHVVVAPLAKIADHTLVNSSATVGHHASVGRYVSICPGARVNGRCVVEEGAFLGSNAAMQPGRKVGAWACVSACSYVVTNVQAKQTVVGIPARSMFKAPADR